MADPKKTQPPKPAPDPKTAPWTAALAKTRGHLGPGAIARIEARAQERQPPAPSGDPVLDLADNLIEAMGNLEKAVAQKRMGAAAAASKIATLAEWLKQLAPPAPEPKAPATAVEPK